MSKTSSYHQSLIESLRDPDEAREYLKAVIEDYPEGFLKALRNVAQATKQMSKVAQSAGIQRESLYRALSENGNPRYDTLINVLDALGIKLTILIEDKKENSVPPVVPTPKAELPAGREARSKIAQLSARTAVSRSPMAELEAHGQSAGFFPALAQANLAASAATTGEIHAGS
jgi:probable addiction module antidote protein